MKKSNFQSGFRCVWVYLFIRSQVKCHLILVLLPINCYSLRLLQGKYILKQTVHPKLGDFSHKTCILSVPGLSDIYCEILKILLTVRLIQWFIDTSKIGELASRAVKDKDLKLDPDTYNAVWQTFMGQDKTRYILVTFL